MSSNRVLVVHIFSTSYAGSTWLNLLLGAHPRAMSVGEIKSILKVGAAVCTIHGQDCPVWPGVVLDDPARNIYHQLHTLTGRDTFVVNNSRKYLWAQQSAGFDQKFIHLVRDGRAIVASHLRKFADRTAWEASRIWRREVRRNLRLMRRQASTDVCHVVYENLKQDTEGQLRRICGFLGLAFDEAMLEFWKADQHFLGGNRGTLFSLMKATGRELPVDPDRRPEGQGPNWDLKYYQDKDPERFRDERWRTELTAGQLRVFSWVGGRLNRRLGY